jgi:hypothetical protein
MPSAQSSGRTVRKAGAARDTSHSRAAPRLAPPTLRRGGADQWRSPKGPSPSRAILPINTPDRRAPAAQMKRPSPMGCATAVRVGVC